MDTDRPPSRRGHEDLEARVGDLEGALHDVANALTVVLGWLEVAEEASTDFGVARAVRLARVRAMHGRSIALRAMNTNEAESELPVPSDAFVEDAATGVQPEARRSNVQVVSRVEDDALQMGVSTPSRALQVLTNVLMNAVSFSPDGGRVWLHASRINASELKFIVRDEGPGFDPSRSKSVFDGLASARKGGSGIGLRYAHQIATEHGGRLRLVNPGPGAEFELSWPSEPAQAQPTRTPSMIGLEGMRLLVVEDDEAVSMLLEAALEAKGALVDTALDQDALAALLTDGLYDAALVDLSPLEPDIVGGLRRIRMSQSRPKVVLITGSAVCPNQAILDQVSAWVRKPFEIGDVVSALLELKR